MYDPTGALAIPLAFEDARAFVDGRASVKQDGEWRVIDVEGRFV